MSVRVEDGSNLARPDEAPPNEWPLGRPPTPSLSPGLELTCTKVAVDLQSITAATAVERIPACLQALTDAWGADSVFVALVDEGATAFETIFAARSTFSACNPEVLKGRSLDEFPWLKTRLAHLRLLEIKDTANASAAQREDARLLAGLNVGAALFIGFSIRGRLGGAFGVWSAAPN